jgi:hypothetical protein
MLSFMSLAYLEGHNFENYRMWDYILALKKKLQILCFSHIFQNKLALCIYGEKRMETDHISVNIGSTRIKSRFFISILDVLD